MDRFFERCAGSGGTSWAGCVYAKARPVEGGQVVSKDDLYARASLVPCALGSFDLYTHSQSVRANLVLVRNRKTGTQAPATNVEGGD